VETWVPGADGTGFGLENLPYGAVSHDGRPPRPAVRVGDRALILGEVPGLSEQLPAGALDGPTLDPILAAGKPAWSALRARLTELLVADSPEREKAERALVPLAETKAELPIGVPDYVDFYSSIEHASNVGRIFRPDAEPLMPNWRHLPVGYHGRSSSVIVSGTPVRRPLGQRPTSEGPPTFGPSRRLDIELELGFVTGPGRPLGEPIPASAARDHIFGFVLVNDWSARDIQRWEYQPLGPFLGKSFATSISAWVVPLEALEPFRVPPRPQDPEPLPYLRLDEDWALDIDLEIELCGTVVSRTNARGLYWTAPQQLAHATANGAPARPGDLFASGTISGPEPGSYGSLLELSWGGRDELDVGSATRTFLEDGDEVVLRGWCGERERPRLAFGEVRGAVLPAVSGV
jgi:fumarylacetoacetase